MNMQQQHQQANQMEKVIEEHRASKESEDIQNNPAEALRAIRQEQDRRKEGETGLESLAENINNLTRKIEEGVREKEEKHKS